MAIYNVYDVLHIHPRLTRRLKPRHEALARAIVDSGRIRLDTDESSNFARLQLSREDLTFTRREVTDPKLLPVTRKRLWEAISKLGRPEGKEALLAEYMQRIESDLKRRQPVDPKIELMMARALVQCNALAVIELIHLEGAEIFISFGQEIGDVMDVESWQQHGSSNGMQSMGGGRNALFISCGGHPFLEEDERRHTGDGFAALARFFVVAAQETGHNGDVIRNAQGQWVGRFSATDWERAPSPKAGSARQMDIQRCERQYERCRKRGLNRVAEWERRLKFYRDQKLWNGRRVLEWVKARFGWFFFKLILHEQRLGHLCTLQGDPYPATLLRTCLEDMLFNLTPVADAYKRKNQQEEEAIATIEAVARVPQQVVKWGWRCVRGCTPGLYRLYYREIVPACVEAVRRIKGTP